MKFTLEELIRCDLHEIHLEDVLKVKSLGMLHY